MFFTLQLRLGNECDFHSMVELARTVLVNLCECWLHQDVPRRMPWVALNSAYTLGVGKLRAWILLRRARGA